MSTKLTAALGLATTAIGIADNLIDQSNRGPGGSEFQNNAVATYRRYGALKSNLFHCEIFPPPVLLRAGGVKPDLIRLYAESTTLPGVQMGTSQVRRYGIGPLQKIANDVIFNDITVNFIGDGGGHVHSFFVDWLNSISPFDQEMVLDKDMTKYYDGTNTLTRTKASTKPVAPFMFEYKDSYCASKFNIFVYNENHREVIAYDVIDAFPIAISDINLGWANNDELMRFSVTFALTRWRIDRINTVDVVEQLESAEQMASDAGPLSMLYRAGSLATLVSSLKKPRNVGDVINLVNNAALIGRKI